MKRARDSQRGKVYQWEHDCLRSVDNEEITLDECRVLINRSWRAYKWLKYPPPTVTDGRRSRRGRYHPMAHVISLPKHARRGWYVLHEVAHAMVPGSLTTAWHGPVWCSVYADLLKRFGGWQGIRESMRGQRIKVGKAP